jgi:AbrB family looped-hinge helix DNA binding protein
MAEQFDIDTKVSSEGRVVIPAAVRAALGVGPGDKVRFVVGGGEVKLVTAQSLLFAV